MNQNKIQINMYKPLLFLALITFQWLSAQEGDPVPPPTPPLISLVTDDTKDTVDFNSLNLEDYPNTTDFDLLRLSPQDWLVNQIGQKTDAVNDLPTSIFQIGDQTAILQGTATISWLGETEIALGTNYLDAQSILLVENYVLVIDEDTIADYLNKYYSYFDAGNSLFLLEVFDKKQLFEEIIGQRYTGVSYNILDYSDQNIALVLSPNPITKGDGSKAAFELWTDGYVTVQITDQTARVNMLVFSGQMSAGSTSVILPTADFPPGTYTVTVLFQEQTFSSTLIIQ